ncbi:hypothetical protein F4604DRAFT_1131367 [Suillus subluteus]|nr:hypothetical protein F4604DRAFT_1131367 [Suillus subluteus]
MGSVSTHLLILCQHRCRFVEQTTGTRRNDGVLMSLESDDVKVLASALWEIVNGYGNDIVKKGRLKNIILFRDSSPQQPEWLRRPAGRKANNQSEKRKAKSRLGIERCQACERNESWQELSESGTRCASAIHNRYFGIESQSFFCASCGLIRRKRGVMQSRYFPLVKKKSDT